MKKINIANPSIGEEEVEAVARVLRSGSLAQGNEVLEFEKEFADYIGTKHAIATSNGSTALLVALQALELEEGSEVITTPFTFLATASSIVLAGLKPVFVDIDPDTFCLDPEKLEEAITDRTKAIMPVHLYGNLCEMNQITTIAKKYNLKIVEDCAQSHGSKYKGQSAGSIGDFGCFSFYPTKNMTTGEGGMITTNNEALATKCRLIRAHGMSAPYKYDLLGFNHRMTNIGAAIGREQLKKLPLWNEKRKENATFYDKNLKNVLTPKHSKDVEHVYHQYTIKCSDPNRLKTYLAENDVIAGVYYPTPLYNYGILEEYKANCKVAEQVSREVLSLPVHQDLKQEDLQRIVDLVNSWTTK